MRPPIKKPAPPSDAEPQLDLDAKPAKASHSVDKADPTPGLRRRSLFRERRPEEVE